MSAKYFETFELKSTWILISKSDFYIFSSYSPMLTSIVTFLWQAKSKDCTKTQLPPFKQKTPPFGGLTFFPSGSHQSRRRFPSVRFGFSVSWMSRSWKRRFCSCSCILKVSCSWRERLVAPRSLFSLNMRWWSKACWTICEWHGKLPKVAPWWLNYPFDPSKSHKIQSMVYLYLPTTPHKSTKCR